MTDDFCVHMFSQREGDSVFLYIYKQGPLNPKHHLHYEIYRIYCPITSDSMGNVAILVHRPMISYYEHRSIR